MMDAISIFNNQAWLIGDMALDSLNFGRIGGTATSPRVLQFAVSYNL